MKRADATSISGYVMGVVIPVRILLDPLARSFSRWISSQAAQDGAAGRVILAELFERIGCFFARLETYQEVADCGDDRNSYGDHGRSAQGFRNCDEKS